VIAFTTAVAEIVGPEARWFHYGLTSNDVVDTAQALLIRQASALIAEDLQRLAEVLERRAWEFKDTPMVGRTHGVHAEPITFGFKLANWYSETQRNIARFAAAAEEMRVGKLSGAVGMFAHLAPEIDEKICALWHVRDFSHSSAYRVILPDSATLIDYLLRKTTNLIETMVVYPERMQANLDSTRGLIFSGQLLLDLVEHGVSREDAYRMVQHHAMRAWKEGRDFRQLVMNDKEITNRVPRQQIEHAFDLKRQLRNIDKIFTRVFGARGPRSAKQRKPRKRARARTM